MGRCIECKGEFNRAVSEDKLRCPKCQKPEEEEQSTEWKKRLKAVKTKK